MCNFKFVNAGKSFLRDRGDKSRFTTGGKVAYYWAKLYKKITGKVLKRG